jgi:hypothetical protein
MVNNAQVARPRGVGRDYVWVRHRNRIVSEQQWRTPVHGTSEGWLALGNLCSGVRFSEWWPDRSFVPVDLLVKRNDL